MSEIEVQNFIIRNGFDSISYSGRCMYGKKCLAIIVNKYVLDELFEEIQRLNGLIDNMAYDYVVYWKDIEYK
jgi:hypothetical protein